jgi:hypothetical protein
VGSRAGGFLLAPVQTPDMALEPAASEPAREPTIRGFDFFFAG